MTQISRTLLVAALATFGTVSAQANPQYAMLEANQYTCNELRVILETQKYALILDSGAQNWFTSVKTEHTECRGWVYKAKDKRFCKVGYVACSQSDDSTVGGP